MFGVLTQKFGEIFQKLTGNARLNQRNVSEATSSVLRALIEADVHVPVARDLIHQIEKKALGTSVLANVTPAQQFAKIVYDEIALLLGASPRDLIDADQVRAKPAQPPQMNWKTPPAVWLVCGLQGSGKTTFCAKLAAYLQSAFQKRVLLGACDLQRPMAIHQLEILAQKASAEVFSAPDERDPSRVGRLALAKAASEGHQILILDTAGRTEVDQSLMDQLGGIKGALSPSEVLFVASAALGQSIAQTARAFHDQLQLTGTVLTMLDGDARGGAVLSMRALTGCPVKFESIGEGLGDLQPFHPLSMTDRLLGMGDTINLVRRAQAQFSEEDSRKIQHKLTTASFSYGDFLQQLQGVKRMGSLASILKMLPGMSQVEISDRSLIRMEALILSMTPAERSERDEMTHSRRRRLAGGSGTSIEEVNKLVKNFKGAKQFFKNMPTNLKQMQKMMGGKSWR